MFAKKRPIFTKGRILKKEMLEAVRDFPQQLATLYLGPYSDGVIRGLELSVQDQQIWIAPGVVKREGQLVILDTALAVDYQTAGDTQLLKMSFSDVETTEDFETLQVEITLEKGVHIKENELELARFKLKSGAYLRTNYQSFSDFLTGYNTLNIVHQPYAGIERPTLHPQILKYFARQLLSYETKDPYDIQLSYQILNTHGSLSREVLIHYCQTRLQSNRDLNHNEQLHQALDDVLQKLGRNHHLATTQVMSRGKLIVD